MGRKKTGRTEPLYTRVTKTNDMFLRRICKTAGMSKTEWLDNHLSYLQNKHSAKARNTIPTQSR